MGCPAVPASFLTSIFPVWKCGGLGGAGDPGAGGGGGFNGCKGARYQGRLDAAVCLLAGWVQSDPSDTLRRVKQGRLAGGALRFGCSPIPLFWPFNAGKAVG